MSTDDYLTLAEAANRSPGRPSSNAVWRWCRKGIKSRSGETVKLNHVRVGGKIYTRQGWLDEFFAATARADAEYFSRPDTKREPKPIEARREKDIARAETELRAVGI